jgi:hypothetical protein
VDIAGVLRALGADVFRVNTQESEQYETEQSYFVIQPSLA